MFGNFTDRARRVIATAQNEAVRLHHDYIGTEHLLLGLCDDSTGVAVTALRSLFPATAANPCGPDNGALYAAVRAEVDKVAVPGKEDSASKLLPFTPDGKAALEHAARIAADVGHPYVGTEHLLLGLILDYTVAREVLKNLGFNTVEIVAKVQEYLGLAAEQPKAEAPKKDASVAHYQVLTGEIASTLDLGAMAEEASKLVAAGWEPYNLVVIGDNFHLPLWKPPEKKPEPVPGLESVQGIMAELANQGERALQQSQKAMKGLATAQSTPCDLLTREHLIWCEHGLRALKVGRQHVIETQPTDATQGYRNDLVEIESTLVLLRAIIEAKP